MEAVPLSDYTSRKSSHATTNSPAWERISARTRRPCCRRRSFGMSVMLTNRDAGKANVSASLLKPADWSASKALRLPARKPSARTKKTGVSAPNNPPMFIENLLETTAKTSLELDLGSESENYDALHAPTHVRVVLNDRLHKEHW